MTCLMHDHSSFQQAKLQQLNDANSLMKGMHEMYSELVDEVAAEEIDETLIDETDVKLEEPLNEQFIYMQKLAGIKPKLITENKK